MRRFVTNDMTSSSKMAVSASRRWFSSSPVTSDAPLFDKILIANRGEIACRVMRTARRMGIKTVAVYSDPDAASLHVRSADEAICVGPAASAQSYLNTNRIMHAIKSTGAQAVHPGYGFLSENHVFAEELEKNGVTFIGPPSSAIVAMGDKIESKLIAEKAGVNIIPGVNALVDTAAEAVKICRDIGYPVMIKASAGGGGKGMRIAWNDKEAEEGFRLSREEAIKSFGDDRMFIEKFIEDPRHIEIQIIADSHGNVVALPERECSIQRRNQKVIEEAPSTLLDPKTRAAMQEQACMLAKAVGYRSAGTVEMLCDKHKNFYFLEMNTRLQVEHPITEMVSGVDLVEQMIRVAAGEELSPEIARLASEIKGWAFESRVYAEDPIRGFLPSTGCLHMYREPPSGEGTPVRVDTGITEGSEISMFYDPLICKLVTHSDTRQAAIDAMVDALDRYVIRGVGHNANFLRDVYVAPRFVKGTITTGYIPEEYPEGFSGVEVTPRLAERMAAIAAVMSASHEVTNSSISGQAARAQPSLSSAYIISVDGREYEARPSFSDMFEVSVEIREAGSDSAFKTIVIGDCGWEPEDPLFDASLAEDDGESTTVCCQHLERLPEGFKLQLEGAVADVICRTPRQHELAKHMIPKPKVDYSKALVSPMPGQLVSVNVTVGQEVEIGQELCVVEAMKMQNLLRSTRKGKIAEICFEAGATLKVDDIILKFEDDE